ncbi:MAG: hypothetical protein NT002_00905 [candidate division Zixibacteria bacterium]|nr:hypothetical protein [candidate division Zixibacteria bacterium]
MSDNGKNEDLEKDIKLDRLIKQARASSTEKFIRPDDATINAYLFGKASEKEEAIIYKAMILSADFRDQMRDMIKDLNNILTASEGISALPDAETPIPDRQVFLRRMEKMGIEDSLYKRPLNVAKKSSLLTTRWQKLQDFMTPAKLIPAAAVAGAFVIMIVAFRMYGLIPGLEPERPVTEGMAGSKPVLASIEIVENHVDPGLLRQVRTRAMDSKQPSINRKFEDSLALASLSEYLVFDEETYLFHTVQNPGQPGPRPQDSVTIIVMQLVDSTMSTIGEFTASIPKSADSSGRRVSAWLLGLPGGPNYKLMRAEIISDTVRAIWTPELGKEGAVVFIYRDGNQYQAVPGFTFQI